MNKKVFYIVYLVLLSFLQSYAADYPEREGVYPPRQAGGQSWHNDDVTKEAIPHDLGTTQAKALSDAVPFDAPIHHLARNSAFRECGGLAFDINADALADTFKTPPPDTRPGVYWYFMDGNQDRDEMTADLKAMVEVGIGKVLFLEVNIGVPCGPVAFMSEPWQDNFVHAVKTAELLGMKFILGTGPGWAGSGGPWVKPEDSMQHLVAQAVQVRGPARFNEKLPVPNPHAPNPFSGMSKEHKKVRDQWYRDVAVLAYRTLPNTIALIEDELAVKTLKDVLPYSIRRTKTRFVTMPAQYGESEVSCGLDMDSMVDLTDQMQHDGLLSWQVPDGNWTIFRFVSRSTGQTTRPAPMAGRGFECDKFNADAFRRHWENFQAKLLKKVQPGKDGCGWTQIHLDSWEMSSQNWTAEFREAFLKRCGYDPKPYYPAFMGNVVENLEITERFLWDMRKTAQDMTLQNHAETIRDIAHNHGMQYSNEPYDMNPAGDLDLGSVADIPMCEFWEKRGHNTAYSCLEATSIAHVMGRPVVEAESFTGSMGFDVYPAQMKNQLDWAFAIGINGIIFHTFQHQPLGDEYKPGMSMGCYGIHWHRNQTWWSMLPAFHQYISRCSHLLRQGNAVADILYVIPEGVPHIFLPPKSAMEGTEKLPDKKGYSFDAVSPRILSEHASVENGYIVFEGGSRYRLMVLPDFETMTPETLVYIAGLIRQGAAVVGHPPRKSPSLVDYPTCDQTVRDLAKKVWGRLEVPQKETMRTYGKGVIFWGGQWSVPEYPASQDSLYPHYDVTTAVLSRLGHCEDFMAEKNVVRFIHRRTENRDIYFVSNRTAEPQELECVFRVSGQKPVLLNPVTGDSSELPQYTSNGTTTRIPLRFAPFESYFVVFDKDTEPSDNAKENFRVLKTIATLDGPWSVSFDPKWGGPADIEFSELMDWRDHTNQGVKYYSGTAVYRKTFDCPKGVRLDGAFVLDLGQMYEMARVKLNGTELGVVWTAPYQIDIKNTLKPVGNELVIEVANSWENRLIGDQRPDDKNVRTVQWESGLLAGKPYKTGRYTFTTLKNRSNKQLLPSGLMGPVLIRTDQDL